MQKLQALRPAMQKDYRAQWQEALEQFQENDEDALDASVVFSLLRIIAEDCSTEELDDVIRQAGAKDGKVSAKALLDVLC